MRKRTDYWRGSTVGIWKTGLERIEAKAVMNESTLGALGETEATYPVQPVRPAGAPGHSAIRPAPGPLRPDARIPGMTEFDQMQVTSSGKAVQAYAKFTVHPQSGMVSIKIIDPITEEVIREIPPEQVIRIAEELQSYLAARNQRRR